MRFGLLQRLNATIGETGDCCDGTSAVIEGGAGGGVELRGAKLVRAAYIIDFFPFSFAAARSACRASSSSLTRPVLGDTMGEGALGPGDGIG